MMTFGLGFGVSVCLFSCVQYYVRGLKASDMTLLSVLRLKKLQFQQGFVDFYTHYRCE